MKKNTVICRLLISFGCIVFLFTGCDDSAKGPTKPTVVRKKIKSQGQTKTTVAAKQPQKNRPVKATPRPAAPAVKPVKTEPSSVAKPVVKTKSAPVTKPPAPKTSPPEPVSPPAKSAPTKPMLAQTDPQKPADDDEVPKPKSDISKLSPQSAPGKTAPQGTGTSLGSGSLLASTSGDRPFYNPAGKIDPFTPLFRDKPVGAILKKKKRKKRKDPTPLERIELGQLKLVGVILASSGNRALVEESSGKGYVIKKGTFIGTNEGRVVDIKRDKVVVEEEFEDVYGKLKVQKKELKLPKPPGEL